MQLPALLDTAIDAARAAGLHAQTQRARRHEVARHFDHDVKLVLDRESQTEAEQVIRNSFPSHRILGEEGESAGGDANAPTWIIDPIDGTVNFFHGFPIWCSSVAVRVEGRMAAGAVFVPDLNELYFAAADTPAYCNGARIRVSPTEHLREAMIVSGITKNTVEDPATFDVLRALTARARKVRIMGAAAVDLCHVARGRAEAYLESGIHIWDIAAGALIVERAGGRWETLEQIDERRERCLCSNGLVHEAIKAVDADVRAARA